MLACVCGVDGLFVNRTRTATTTAARVERAADGSILPAQRLPVVGPVHGPGNPLVDDKEGLEQHGISGSRPSVNADKRADATQRHEALPQLAKTLRAEFSQVARLFRDNGGRWFPRKNAIKVACGDGSARSGKCMNLNRTPPK